MPARQPTPREIEKEALMTHIVKVAAVVIACLCVAACGSLTLQSAGKINAMDTTMGSYASANEATYIIVTMTDAVFDELVQGERVDREGALPPLYARFLANLARTYDMRRVADWPLNTLGARCLVFEVADAARRDATIAALSGERFVESAQRLNGYRTSGEAAVTLAYNDPYRKMQHGLDLMQVDETHRWATGRGVRVAVIDTGMDTQHPDLSARVVGIRNFVDRDNRAFNADVHGTAIAGVIAAESNNAVGLVGVAPEAEIVSLKACWQVDRGASCNTFTLAKALNFAIDQGVDIINLSLGGPPDALLARLVAKAMERNILVVGAVSPDWPDGFPAAVDGVIAVANSTAMPTKPSTVRMVSAPGSQVLSARPQREYDFFTGSSFSTAHVAGVAALIRQRKPHLSGPVVKDLITTTAQTDHHVANACRAVVRVIGEGDCASPMAASPSPQR
jgi:hypothetical protein